MGGDWPAQSCGDPGGRLSLFRVVEGVDRFPWQQDGRVEGRQSEEPEEAGMGDRG